MRRIWWELVRPRGHVAHRFYRGSRSSRSGVALLLVIANLLLLTVLVSEITYGATVRLQLAAHGRDEAKAAALARSGAEMYRLILVASKQLGKQIQNLPIPLPLPPGDALWQMIPFINTGLMRMIFVSGGDLDEEEAQEMETVGLTEEQLEESRDGSGREKGFLDFDGDFFAEVVDEDRKINLSSIRATSYAELMEDPTAMQLYSLMSGRRRCGALDGLMVDGTDVQFDTTVTSTADVDDHDQFFYDLNRDRWELIANLADWTDADTTRMYQGGQEEAVYQQLPDPYKPKNAGFESMDELRLVDGWHLDSVWERYGKYVTVYGSGKVNVNTAECEVMWALLQAYVKPNTPEVIEKLAQEIEMVRVVAPFTSANQFKQLVESKLPAGATVDPKLVQEIGTESTVFRVTSTGEVGDASVTLTVVYDFGRSKIGKVSYWRVE